MSATGPQLVSFGTPDAAPPERCARALPRGTAAEAG